VIFIDIISSIAAMQARADELRQQGRTIVFVPTMGFLHEGHLSLLKEGQKHGDVLVLSIFVNPTQFGPNEDFDTYPQDMAHDLKLARNTGIDIVFTPQRDDLYGDEFETYVSLENLPNHLCGLSRPIFFRGVATVVTKLFHIVKPHTAIFGEKDFQQLTVIKKMVRNLNLDIKIIGSPIVRENDGLAMSSRNSYLTTEQRPAALSLYRSLQQAQSMVKKGEKNTRMIIEAVSQEIQAHPDTVIDYITVCDSETLEDITLIENPVLMALAVKVGKTRLIDNMMLG
jgi:pantoate--beta-alanine ligase